MLKWWQQGLDKQREGPTPDPLSASASFAASSTPLFSLLTSPCLEWVFTLTTYISLRHPIYLLVPIHRAEGLESIKACDLHCKINPYSTKGDMESRHHGPTESLNILEQLAFVLLQWWCLCYSSQFSIQGWVCTTSVLHRFSLNGGRPNGKSYDWGFWWQEDPLQYTVRPSHCSPSEFKICIAHEIKGLGGPFWKAISWEHSEYHQLITLLQRWGLFKRTDCNLVFFQQPDL